MLLPTTHHRRRMPLWLPALGLAATLQANAACSGNESDFAPYQESFAVYNKIRNTGWAGADQAALRAFFSFKYTVFGQHYVPKRARLPGPGAEGCASTDIEIFLSYTGSFDFYAGTRDSGPVINRLNNPAVALRVPLRKLLPWGDADDNFIFSVEHRSDGQVLDPHEPLVRERANHAYAVGDHTYFDAMSRGSNFVGLAAELTDAFKVNTLDLRLKWRQHFNQESAVTWGPLANADPKISDYDRLHVQASYRARFGWLDAGWRIGAKGMKTDSWTLGWQAPSKHFPLYLRYHRGPMNTLANYTQRQDSIGAGLRFARPFDNG